VWAFQFRGGAAPQWAGRYILPTTLVLLAVGAARLPEMRRAVAIGFAALSVTVTGFGVAWTSVRTHEVGDAASALAAIDEPVVVSRLAHLWREVGAEYTPQRRWLTVPTRDQVGDFPDLLDRIGVDRLAWIDIEGSVAPRRLGSFVPAGRRTVTFLSGVDLTVTTYRRP
jgi:hypothetical protein